MSACKAHLSFEHDGRVACVTLAAPKANILDGAMMAELKTILSGLQGRTDLCAIVFSAAGPHFSFGASVEEHLPEKIEATLRQLHDLLARMVALPAPTIATVQGRCLGGGFELVLACDLILAEETAEFACPEIQLGVFPPAASALLPVRIGAGPAASLVITGESWAGSRAAEVGLVSRTAAKGDLESALTEWLESDFLARSPAALKYAARASRRRVLAALEHDLPELERLYLQDLMSEPDATEGLRAFLEKRRPVWGRKEKAGAAS